MCTTFLRGDKAFLDGTLYEFFILHMSIRLLKMRHEKCGRKRFDWIGLS